MYLVSPLILLLSSSSMFSLLLSDVVGLPGLFSSPFMSPLVRVRVIKRVVVNRKVVVTGRVVVIMRVENVQLLPGQLLAIGCQGHSGFPCIQSLHLLRKTKLIDFVKISRFFSLFCFTKLGRRSLCLPVYCWQTQRIPIFGRAQIRKNWPEIVFG